MDIRFDETTATGIHFFYMTAGSASALIATWFLVSVFLLHSESHGWDWDMTFFFFFFFSLLLGSLPVNGTRL